MNRYAQLSGNKIIVVIESETDPDGTNGGWIACGDAGPGWVYDGSTFSAPEAPPARRFITILAFRNRFTLAEKVTIEIASLDNPAAPMAARQQAAALRANQADSNAATYIDIDRPDTRAGVIGLEAAGVIGAGRALQILDAPVQQKEVPVGG